MCSFETHLCEIRERSEGTTARFRVKGQQLGLQVTTLLAHLGGEEQMPHPHQRSFSLSLFRCPAPGEYVALCGKGCQEITWEEVGGHMRHVWQVSICGVSFCQLALDLRRRNLDGSVASIRLACAHAYRAFC